MGIIKRFEYLKVRFVEGRFGGRLSFERMLNFIGFLLFGLVCFDVFVRVILVLLSFLFSGFLFGIEAYSVFCVLTLRGIVVCKFFYSFRYIKGRVESIYGV